MDLLVFVASLLCQRLFISFLNKLGQIAGNLTGLIVITLQLLLNPFPITHLILQFLNVIKQRAMPVFVLDDEPLFLYSLLYILQDLFIDELLNLVQEKVLLKIFRVHLVAIFCVNCIAQFSVFTLVLVHFLVVLEMMDHRQLLLVDFQLVLRFLDRFQLLVSYLVDKDI